MSSVQSLLVFSEAAKQGSFAGAARELGLSPSAVVKSVARLEEALQVRLFQRTTRKVQLTQAGEALFGRCQKVLSEFAELQTTAANVSQEVTGVLRVDLPVTYGRQVVLPILARLAENHPGLGLDVRLSDSYNDVIAGGFDAVVRIGGAAKDSRLIGRVFDSERLGAYASPDYLERRGRPKDIASLAGHECLRYRLPNTGRNRPMQFRVSGKFIELNPECKYASNDGEALVLAASAGLGVVQAPRYLAAAALSAGSLSEILARFEPPPLPIAVVFPSKRQMPARLRLFIDALTLGRDPPRPPSVVADKARGPR